MRLMKLSFLSQTCPLSVHCETLWPGEGGQRKSDHVNIKRAPPFILLAPCAKPTPTIAAAATSAPNSKVAVLDYLLEFESRKDTLPKPI